MRCPVCNIDLLLAERHGIEIDYCSKCRGIWLDRGELDKIIERVGGVQTQNSRGHHREADSYYAPQGHHQDYHKPQGNQKHKRKSFLQEIFDFD